MICQICPGLVRIIPYWYFMFQDQAETFDEVIHQNNVIAVIGEGNLCEKEAEVVMERKGDIGHV